MTSDDREVVARHLAKLVVATKSRTEMVADGEITPLQANEENELDVMRLRADLTNEQFQLLMDGVGKISYLMSRELSAAGEPVAGNDPQKPN